MRTGFLLLASAVVVFFGEGVQASMMPGERAASQNEALPGLKSERFVRGETIALRPARSGMVSLTGWSKPELDPREVARIAGDTEFGRFKAAKEIVIAYPDDYVFDLADPLLQGIKNTWNGYPKGQLCDKHYSVVAVEGDVRWRDLQPEKECFDFSELDALLAWCAYTQKPTIFKFNAPAPEWIFDEVAHVGGKTPIDKKGYGGGVSRLVKGYAESGGVIL